MYNLFSFAFFNSFFSLSLFRCCSIGHLQSPLTLDIHQELDCLSVLKDCMRKQHYWALHDHHVIITRIIHLFSRRPPQQPLNDK